MRGDRKKQEGREKASKKNSLEESKAIDIRKYKAKRIPQLMWRECIKKVWEVDPLVCPKCTGEMKSISFIYKRVVIKKILTHLEIYERKEQQRAPPEIMRRNSDPVKILPYDDGWPGYDELVYEF